MLLISCTAVSENKGAGAGVGEHHDVEEAAGNAGQELPLLREKTEQEG